MGTHVTRRAVLHASKDPPAVHEVLSTDRFQIVHQFNRGDPRNLPSAASRKAPG
jgi:hypothetical protein